MVSAEATREPIRKIGSRLKMIRDRMGMTQRQFAAILEVSPGYLSDVENQNVNVNADILYKISITRPEISLRWLVNGFGEMFLPRIPDWDDRHTADDRDPFVIDQEAARSCNEAFLENLRAIPAASIDHAIAHRATLFAYCYKSYMVHFTSLINQGLEEAEARRLAHAECVRHAEPLPMEGRTDGRSAP